MRALVLALLCLMCLSVVNAQAFVPAKTDAGVQAPPAQSDIFKPIKKQIVRWTILINKEVPKRMRVLRKDPSALVIAGSFFAALIYGILHALGPGHGKTLVSSYFLTNDARWWRGVFVGVQVAISHVVGAIILVFVTKMTVSQIFASQQTQFFWIKAISYGLIIAIGGFLLVQAVRRFAGWREESHDECACISDKTRTRQELLLAWSAGAVPCTGSLLILLYAMAHDMLGLGLVLVFFVAIGMALTITAAGCLCIVGKKKLINRCVARVESARRIQASIEFVGATIIISFGAVLLAGIL